MAMGLEPVFAPGAPVWPLAGMALSAFEADDPDLAIPRGALQAGQREAAEHIRILDQSARLTVTPPEPLRVVATGPAERKRKWIAALVVSCVCHAAVALFFIGMSGDEVLLEGSEHSGILFLGSAPEDQIKAGDLVEKNYPNAVAVTMIAMLEAKLVKTVEAETAPAPQTVQSVDTVEADPLQTETLQPVAERPAEEAPQDEPTQAIPSKRAEPAMTAPPPPAVEIPHILAADTLQPVKDDQAVPEIAKTGPAEASEPVEAALQPTVAETVDPEPEISVGRIPLPTPRPERLVDTAERTEPIKQVAPRPKSGTKAAPNRKPAKKPAAQARQSGNGGQNQSDSQRGQADGHADGRTAAKSKGRKNSAAGNAAVSNYPGEVLSKLRRALRYPAAAKRQRLRGEAHVQFTVAAGGGIGAVRIVRSSGSPVLDKAAIETVRRAAPFPAIPFEAGRSKWPFTVPLAFARQN